MSSKALSDERLREILAECEADPYERTSPAEVQAMARELLRLRAALSSSAPTGGDDATD